eukprot:2997696-Alexandrium_andersonii.AAC.1
MSKQLTVDNIQLEFNQSSLYSCKHVWRGRGATQRPAKLSRGAADACASGFRPSLVYRMGVLR